MELYAVTYLFVRMTYCTTSEHVLDPTFKMSLLIPVCFVSLAQLAELIV